jgi:hypothetical protein
LSVIAVRVPSRSGDIATTVTPGSNSLVSQSVTLPASAPVAAARAAVGVVSAVKSSAAAIVGRRIHR